MLLKSAVFGHYKEYLHHSFLSKVVRNGNMLFLWLFSHRFICTMHYSCCICWMSSSVVFYYYLLKFFVSQYRQSIRSDECIYLRLTPVLVNDPRKLLYIADSVYISEWVYIMPDFPINVSIWWQYFRIGFEFSDYCFRFVALSGVGQHTIHHDLSYTKI